MIYINGKEITDEEYNALITNATKWSKEAHLAEINALHEAEFKRRLTDAEYVGEWELNVVLTDTENEYYDEAVLIINYWWDGWNAIKEYSETVTENNFIEPLDFVNGL